MEETLTLDVPRADTEYEAAIDKYLAELERMTTEMADRQPRIERLQAETQAKILSLNFE